MTTPEHYSQSSKTGKAYLELDEVARLELWKEDKP
jgi:hypothetical protein